MTQPAQTQEIALLRSELLLPLARIEGHIQLVLQRLDQADQRAVEHAAELRRLDERQDILDRELVPRAEIEGIRTALLGEFRREIAGLKQNDTELRSELRTELTTFKQDNNSRAARVISIIGVIVAALSAAVAVLALLLH